MPILWNHLGFPQINTHTSLSLTTWQAWADDRSKISQNVPKNLEIIEFHYYIWNHHRKCSQISTNMPGIGLVIIEIVLWHFENSERTKNILHGKINGHAQRVETQIPPVRAELFLWLCACLFRFVTLHFLKKALIWRFIFLTFV